MFHEIVTIQRKFFLEGNTRDVTQRVVLLKQLKQAILDNQDKLFAAFLKDFNKCEFEVITNELSLVIDEINYMISHISKAFKWKKVPSNLMNFPSSAFTMLEPYGVVLIMSPWNYPLQLALIPLIGAIACGNTVVLKPSEFSENVSFVLKEILSSFDERLISVFLGDASISQQLLEERFDYIFFTGSERVGKIVMQKASQYLTPLTLELGGKSPCIVTKDANIALAAKRITWGKFLNAGQTCVAPDYIMVQECVKDVFVEEVKKNIQHFYYENGTISSKFTHIISQKQIDRLLSMIDEEKVVWGGKNHGLLLEPTILNNVHVDDSIMQEEIFGPIMPILSFKHLKEVIDYVSSHEKPLALYLFSKNKQTMKEVFTKLSFGGGCFNDTIMHLSNPKLPFGGVGNSGMGSYHGAKSIETFTHKKSIFIKGKMEIQAKFPPYSEKTKQLVRKITGVKK